MSTLGHFSNTAGQFFLKKTYLFDKFLAYVESLMKEEFYFLVSQNRRMGLFSLKIG